MYCITLRIYVFSFRFLFPCNQCASKSSSGNAARMASRNRFLNRCVNMPWPLRRAKVNMMLIATQKEQTPAVITSICVTWYQLEATKGSKPFDAASSQKNRRQLLMSFQWPFWTVCFGTLPKDAKATPRFTLQHTHISNNLRTSHKGSKCRWGKASAIADL